MWWIHDSFDCDSSSSDELSKTKSGNPYRCEENKKSNVEILKISAPPLLLEAAKKKEYVRRYYRLVWIARVQGVRVRNRDVFFFLFFSFFPLLCFIRWLLRQLNLHMLCIIFVRTNRQKKKRKTFWFQTSLSFVLFTIALWADETKASHHVIEIKRIWCVRDVAEWNNK